MTRLALLFALLAAWASPACAEPSAADRDAVRAVISSQLDAFKRDDGPAAYGFAAEPIRRMFPDADSFLDMVRKAYQPVYRPRTVVFGQISDGAAGPEQEVLITDQNGVDWVARYSLEQQADGSWRITGCRLVRNEGGSA